MPHSLLTVPHEILLGVCEHLPRGDLTRFARTSKAIATAATPRLYDELFFQRITQTDHIAKLRSEFVLDYVAAKSNQLISFRTPEGWSILHSIAAAGNEVLLAAFLQQGADISARATKGRTAVRVALENGKDAVAVQLIEAGAEVATPTRYQTSLRFLHNELSKPTVEKVIQAVQTARGDISARGPGGHTALHYHSRRGNDHIVRILVENGADTLAADKFGLIPLVSAILRRKVDVSRILLEAMTRDSRGYDVNAPLPSLSDISSHWHGFETSVSEAYPGTVRALVNLYKQGMVNLDIKAATPSMLSACAYYGHHVPSEDINDTVTSFLSAGADVDYQDKDGKTALHRLCEVGDSEHNAPKIRLMEYFLDRGADWTIRDDDGNTVLHAAAGNTESEYDVETIELLRETGADINAVNPLGQTVAHRERTLLSSRDAADFLVWLGLDISLRDHEGKPPFHYVVEAPTLDDSARETMIRYFVEKEADLHDGCKQCEAQIVKLYPGKQHDFPVSFPSSQT
ncbi:ankyrin [Aspergillus lucknowensis]|uniref:Ankyrin n=1 Tax=Aspergillus lucknowensis TaxID=176173 RepID=A0ABR4LYN6_9EURO